MTALTQGRATKRRDNKRFSYPVAANATIYAGGMFTLLNSGGWAVPAGTASAGIAVGVAQETVSGGGTNGLNRVEGEVGCFHFANSTSTDEITHTEIGKPCYIVDDQTVAKTDNSGARQIAGAVVGVDSLGVWVDVRPGAVGPQGEQGEPG